MASLGNWSLPLARILGFGCTYPHGEQLDANPMGHRITCSSHIALEPSNRPIRRKLDGASYDLQDATKNRLSRNGIT